jgi:hypothetical protein
VKKIGVILALAGSLGVAPALADQETLIALREHFQTRGITLAAASASAIGKAPRNSQGLADALGAAVAEAIRAAPPGQAATIAAAAAAAAPENLAAIIVVAITSAPEYAVQIANGVRAAAPKASQDAVYRASAATIN